MSQFRGLTNRLTGRKNVRSYNTSQYEQIFPNSYGTRSDRFRVAKAITVFALLILSSLFAIIVFSDQGSAFPHNPILIAGNSNFTALNGVSAGDGSESNPYIIAGWDIDAGSANGIVIRNTTAHFRIQNVNVYSNNFTGTAKGVHLYNVQNGTIADSIVRGGLQYGIHLENVWNTSVQDTNVSDINWFAAIVSENSDLVRIHGNNVTNCTNCIYLLTSQNVTVSENNLSWAPGGYGVTVSNSPDIDIYGNRIWDVYYQIQVFGSQSVNITISRNTLYSLNSTIGRSTTGIALLSNANRNSISLNTLYDIANGVYVQQSNDIAITSNNFSVMASDIGTNGALRLTITGNQMCSGVYLYGSDVTYYNSHNITTDNLVNGAPLRYYKNLSGSAIDGLSAGQLLLANCSSTTVSNLQISDAVSGIQAAYLDGVTIENCTILSSIFYGLNLMECDDTVIHGNNISDSGSHGLLGITLDNTEISNNTFYNNSNDGVRLDYTDWTNVTANLIWSNYDHGLELYRCNGGNVTLNNIVDNGAIAGRAGLYVSVNTVNFMIFNNNIVNNTIQAYDVMANTWNDTYPIGGNYWDNYTGTDNYSGVNQDILGADGIGDTPFIIDLDSQDNYPLMEPIPEFGELIVPIVSIVGMMLVLGLRSARRPNRPD